MKPYQTAVYEKQFQISKSRWTAISAAILFLPFLFVLNLFSFEKQENRFWETKDYRQWTEKECQTILFDSPWAKNLVYNSNGYVVQLFSALPIRQALVRQREIALSYEKLPLQKQQELDKETEKYLSEQFSEEIVIHVVSGHHLGGNKYGRPDSFPCPYWQNQTSETLKDTVTLIPSRGDRIPLERFVISQPNVCEFRFVFPRQYKGRPVLSEEDKFVRLEFTGPPATSILSNRMNADPERMLFEFKLSEMKINGKIVF